ncbi:MAG TPA: CDGSH iron-sulfur domain-containing protein [Gemmatimonadales bacterium]|nr:CDGSH iron-sulfur domain-containing protein [Gemmatimonadales bacterium]
MSDDATSITIKPAGPYLVRGPVTILDNEGNPIEPPPAKTPGVVKLCGCGRSATKPFCDASHNKPREG